jgi:hypothetical protein
MKDSGGMWEEWVLALGAKDRNQLSRERNLSRGEIEELRAAVRRRQWMLAARRYKAGKKKST